MLLERCVGVGVGVCLGCVWVSEFWTSGIVCSP